MKYLKTYENINLSPQIGDYVICQDFVGSEELNIFLSNNIGVYFRQTTTEDRCIITYPYMVRYENIPFELKMEFNSSATEDNCRAMRRDEIIFFSSNKKEAELLLATNKYNV